MNRLEQRVRRVEQAAAPKRHLTWLDLIRLSQGTLSPAEEAELRGRQLGPGMRQMFEDVEQRRRHE